MQKIGATAVRLQLATMIVTALVLGGCSNDSSSPGTMTTTPLAQHGRVPRTTGTMPGTVTLSWIPPTENTNGTPLTDLAGYHIRYGRNPEELTTSIDLSGTNTTAYEISGLAPGTYYFAISAYTAMGTESAESAVGYKTI
jgi:hypothetical protein